ncbi:MAG: hypothetical protein CO117_10330 [Flavobacteriaceae bacterium CG_4_9_14_3_um_filter_33_16]|nr:MAG: hypothetical protein CO117_10330 [Flavobacteriaceae bacterium CG_4_9_14_3_um_filter_33_16]
MKNLGKHTIKITVNGVPNGKTVTQTVYEQAGLFYVNHLSSKKQIQQINGEYIVNHNVRAISMLSMRDICNKFENHESKAD